MGERCECETPCIVPFSEVGVDQSEIARDWLMCDACGVDWMEDDAELVERVHAENDAYHAAEAAREAGPRCGRHKDGHRYITLRSGKQVCRDCGGEG